MSDVKIDAKGIFLEALDCPGPQEQARFLEEACGVDAALRARVDELLRAHRDAGAFLGGAAQLEATRDQPVAERPGSVIGPYKLLEQIGEGGFGVVFMAEQAQPIRRKVALKVLKPGMDTRHVVARFEAERQALALMDHPNIAKVLDGGATASGRPYFVMELVKGVPITDFCDQKQLTPRQRLELFLAVCRAVQHAHHKGIIHRDLKPSNVLVMMHDTTPLVKVIDFGVAKALGQELTDKTLFTGFAQLIGTPLYMSPEQAGQSGLDIDTRSDVYSLGVLLYELLTGSTPFDRERFKRAAHDEMCRIIREEEPPRPSTRLSESHASLATISARRHTEPNKLTRLVRGELDWIVMKALEKDRNRRFETVSALARDVEHYLNDEPVQACPPSAWYRLHKFARRHRQLVAGAAVVLCAALGVAISLTVAYQETRSANVIRKEQEATQTALRQAEHFRGQAERSTALLAFERGLALCERGEPAYGCLWLARSLQMAPADAPDLQHAIRANLAAWTQQLGYRLTGILEHEGAVHTVAVSPDGKTALTAANDFTARLWDLATLKPKATLRHDARDVQCAVFSPDGKLVLTAGNDNTARLWDAATGAPNGEPARHPDMVTTAAFSPDGRRFATSTNRTLYLWDTGASKPVAEVPAPAPSGGFFAFRPDGKALVAGSWTTRVWDLVSLKMTSEFHSDRANAGVYRPDGKTILVGLQDGRVLEWDPSQPSPLQAWMPNFASGNRGIVVGPNLHRLPMEHQGRVTGIGYTPDLKTIWTSGGEGNVQVWDAVSGAPRGSPIQQPTTVYGAAFTPDQQTLLTAGADGRARVWALTPVAAPTLPARPQGVPTSVAFRADGKVFATSSMAGKAELWDVATGQRVGKAIAHSKGIYSAAFSPDGQSLVTACGDGAAYLWHAATGSARGTPLRHEATVFSATFSPDGTRVLTGSRDSTARLWDAATATPVGAPMEHANWVHAAVFSPDGKSILTGCEDGTAHIWDAATGKALGTPLSHRGPVRAVAWSPDGQAIMTGVWGEGTAWLWDVKTRRPRAQPLLHREHVTAVAFHPGGRLVATASWDGTARLWDAATGKPVGPPLSVARNKELRTIAFSPDGSRIVAGAASPGPIAMWEVSSSVAARTADLAVSVEALTGMELDASGLYRMLDAQAWQQRRRPR
jgi:WD40 repeat protein/serine/threonine protein kinase